MNIPELQRDVEREIASIKTAADVRAVRDRYLSRKSGKISLALKELGAASPDERRTLGQALNGLKQYAEEQLDKAERALAEAPPADAIDVTLPGRTPLVGHRHPLTLLRERVEQIFLRMGFYIAEGPELEDDYHNFEALNMPAEHPARDMQDTLYLATPVPAGEAQARPATLLRTHTSGMQIRYMETHQPPVRLIAPGRVYRRDGLDLTHSPMFTQVEGLVVDEGITLADLKGTLVTLAHELFGHDRGTRFRPSFFPYTEPSAELDISCAVCGGAGCSMCKGSGWIEVLGSGMVHPAVFESVGYDPERFTGFAFGVGIERLALLKWGIEDIRLFYENDLRFLEQFPL